MENSEYKYDVALSFAGEQRVYVEEVAQLLKHAGISVFYDRFEEVDLWGNDLAIEFDYVYRRRSKYFIPFISKEYKAKIWTNWEVKNAISRAIENKEEYILPVTFDHTEIDGIRSTIKKVDISNMLPLQLSELIIAKVKSIPLIIESDTKIAEVYLSDYIQTSETYGIIGLMIGVNVTNLSKEHRYFQSPYFQLSQPIEGENDTFHMIDQVTKISFPQKLEFGQQYQVYFELKKGFLEFFRKYIGQKATITAHVVTTIGEKFSSNPLSIDELYKFEK